MIKAIVINVLSTVFSDAYVGEVLLPYARAHLRSYILDHQDELEVFTQLEAVCAELGQKLTVEQCCDQLEIWMDEGSKPAPLKTLQEMLWGAGYSKAELSLDPYDNAGEILQLWKKKGIRLYSYSSLSIMLQKLLFRHNSFGDMTPLFSDIFDTQIGHRHDSSSYEVIASQINERAGDILFISDDLEELNAARTAGMQTRWFSRDVQRLDSITTHPQINDFDAICID